MALTDVSIYKAFTSPAASGNPAAVIVLPKSGVNNHEQASSHINEDDFPYALSPPESTLQAVAKQINSPMTAFLIPLAASTNDGESVHYALRWFNPTNEAPLCGHATIALSYHLFNTLPNPPSILRYRTRFHGVVSASLYQSPFENKKLVGIQFPELTDILALPKGGERWDALKNVFEDAMSSTWEGVGEPLALYEGPSYVLLEYSPMVNLKELRVDVSKLSTSGVSPKIVCLFQISAQQPEHAHTRIFNTGSHSHEDIATGSAHCVIVPHILSDPTTRARLEKYHPDFKGKTLRIVQQSAEGGELVVEWLQKSKMVLIMGEASFIEKNTIEVHLP